MYTLTFLYLVFNGCLHTASFNCSLYCCTSLAASDLDGDAVPLSCIPQILLYYLILAPIDRPGRYLTGLVKRILSIARPARPARLVLALGQEADINAVSPNIDVHKGIANGYVNPLTLTTPSRGPTGTTCYACKCTTSDHTNKDIIATCCA